MWPIGCFDKILNFDVASLAYRSRNYAINRHIICFVLGWIYIVKVIPRCSAPFVMGEWNDKFPWRFLVARATYQAHVRCTKTLSSWLRGSRQKYLGWRKRGTIKCLAIRNYIDFLRAVREKFLCSRSSTSCIHVIVVSIKLLDSIKLLHSCTVNRRIISCSNRRS